MGIAETLTEEQAYDINRYLLSNYEPSFQFGLLQIKLKNGEIVLTTFPLIMENGVIYVE